LQHDHHDLTVAAMHAHLDHENCLESVIPKRPDRGRPAICRDLMAERGVRHGKLNVIALEANSAMRPRRTRRQAHVHYRP
jgi:CopG family nickel-responsive transcriptional regulator